MANLGGSTFQKQIKNALSRLNAIGQKRHQTGSHKTHSIALMKKRSMYLNNYADFMKNKGLKDKLNNLFTKENIAEFLNDRLSDLNHKTALDYVAGFNSMLIGLEQVNISIPKESHAVLKEFREDYRNEFNQIKDNFQTGRAINDTETFLNNLEQINQSSAVVAEIQVELGFRASEAIEVAKNFNNYYNPSTNEIKGIVGKGGQEYIVKNISKDLAYKIQNLTYIPSYSSYYQNIKQLEHKTHDLRITFAKNYYENLREKEYTYKEALKLTSENLNHHRESITLYYLKRA